MKLGTLRGRAVLLDGQDDEPRALDVAQASAGRFPYDVRRVLGVWSDFLAWVPEAPWRQAMTYDAGDLGPPVPDPRQVFAVALNYAPHAAEAGFTPPEVPLVFTKFPTCVVGPDATVTLPSDRVDWEVELVAVVGEGGRDIAEADAWSALAGLTLGQDLSERRVQFSGTPPQFSLGKSYAGFGPVGPWIVTPDELTDPDDVGFASTLDGEPLQAARSGDMVFSVPRLVAYLSSVCELLPGDLVFTGTPEGVGGRMDPPRYLAPGQTLVSRADGIGEIVQRFV